MYQPVDYPVRENTDKSAAGEMTYAMLMDRHATQQVITDDMIQSASISMEAAQQLPSASRPTPVKEPQNEAILARLLNVIR